MSRVVLVLLGALSLMWPPPSARAEIIQFKMTGTVTVVDPTSVLPTDVITGAPFTALLAYDNAAPDVLPDNPREGRYVFNGPGFPYGLTLSVGSLLLQNDPSDDFILITTNNQFPGAPETEPKGDFFQLGGVRSRGGPDVFVPTITMDWRNYAGSSWDSDALPAQLDASVFDETTIWARGGFSPGGRQYSVVAVVSDVVEVPEPTSRAIVLTLITAYLLCLLVAKRKRWNAAS